MITISATKARANLYDLIDEIYRTGNPVGITKFGVIKAILVSVKEYDRMVGKVYGKKRY